ncbi:hypothetical protein DP49_5699 [Burkholderia pseudomallei]|nr:hypothetical protein DP49_5699 [Burkholderia pseudomallei]
MLAPVIVVVPPVCCTEPVPEITPPKVRPLLLKLSKPLLVTGPVTDPVAPPAPSCRVLPVSMVVPPEYVLLPVNMVVPPIPFCSRLPVPEMVPA